MIKNIFNCISIHNGGGITYLSMLHSELDRKENLILLDYRARNSLKPFINAEIKYFKKNILRNFNVFLERLKKRKIYNSYFKNFTTNEFFSEYYLNGIPPLFRFPYTKNKTYILFQNRNLFVYQNYLNNQLFFNLKFIIYHILHSLLINLFLKRTDTIIVQTNSMKKVIKNLKPNNNIIIQDNYWKNLSKNKIISLINYKKPEFDEIKFQNIILTKINNQII